MGEPRMRGSPTTSIGGYTSTQNSVHVHAKHFHSEAGEGRDLLDGKEHSYGSYELAPVYGVGANVADNANNQTFIPQVFSRRWYMLALYIMCVTVNISHFTSAYSLRRELELTYNESLPKGRFARTLCLDGLSYIFLGSWLFLWFPVNYILRKSGSRMVVSLGISLTAFGASLKCMAVHGNLFALLFLAQTAIAFGLPFLAGMNVRLATLWFANRQLNTAIGLGFAALPLGMGLGAALSPVIVTSVDGWQESDSLKFLFVTVAITSAILFFLVILTFENAPPVPPSYAQAEVQSSEECSFVMSVWNVVKERESLLVIISSGAVVSVIFTMQRLVWLTFRFFFPNYPLSGNMAVLVFNICGLVGSAIEGYVIDVTSANKEAAVITSMISVGVIVSYTLTAYTHVAWMVTIQLGLFGFIVHAVCAASMALGTEIVYPESEVILASLVMATAMISTGMVFLINKFIEHGINLFMANLTVAATCLLTAVTTIAITPNYKRRTAN